VSRLGLDALRLHEATLANGARVVVVPQPALHRVALGVYVGVGSRYETPKTNGISHFLEHMLYRGTDAHPSAHALNLAFERLGGSLYAATHADHTYLAITTAPRRVDEALALLGEAMRAPLLTSIDVERRIVREEILEDLDEDGRQVDVDNVVRALAFGDHPLGWTITGPLDAVDRWDEATLRAHLGQHYVGENVVVTIAGPVDPAEAVAWAGRAFEPLPRGERVLPSPFEPTQRALRRKHVPSPGSQSDLRLSFVTPGEKSPLAAPIELMLRVLDDGMSTRLYHRLVDEGGLVYDCEAIWEPFLDCGAFDFAAEVQHPRIAEVVDACVELARDLCAHGAEDDELDKSRDRHRFAVESMLDDAEGLAEAAGGAVFFDRPKSPSAWAARFDAVDRDAIAAAAREVFRPERANLVTVGTMPTAVREPLRKALAKLG
jgi:predicted Zn-dependent peptidase